MLAANEFVHLHLHSEYSLLDGAVRVTDIPRLAKENGHEAVALTDHGVMYGAVAFYRACMAEGIRPIIGCEVYVAPGSRHVKVADKEANYYHLVLLVENEVGYRNLITLVSRAYTEGFYSKPRVDGELLSQYHEGLICLTGCLGGYIPSLLSRGDYDEAKRYAMFLSDIFGEEQSKGAKQAEYIRRLVKGVNDHAAELDGYIAKYAKGWSFARIPLVASAIMRVAMYEMLYMPEIPNGAAINEAVEIAKKYETPETVKFMNGILGSFVRQEVGE